MATANRLSLAGPDPKMLIRGGVKIWFLDVFCVGLI
jgi:hypothetical protein